MKTFLTISLTLGLVGCLGGQTAPTKPRSSAVNNANVNVNNNRPGQAFEISLPPQACSSGGQIWSLQNQTIDWYAYKGDKDEEVHGVIKAAGWLALNSNPNMEIFFSSTSLDSQSELRDDRIKEYILGLLERQELRVVITNINQIANQLNNASSVASSVNFEGDLHIYGQTLSVEIPAQVWTEGRRLKIKSEDGAGIDLGQSPFMNSKIQELLDIAEVPRMQELVKLSFEITFVDGC